jgi:hypothetical protein
LPVSRPRSAARLRRSASFRRLTGISAAAFARVIEQRRGSWGQTQRRKRKPGRPREIGGLEGHLLVLLPHHRCRVTQEVIGLFHRVDRSVIGRAIRRIEAPVKRLFGIRRVPRIERAAAEALTIDCTEQPIQRPRDDASQRAHRSGKRKRHTLKAEYIVPADGRIAGVSPPHPGSHHDPTIRRTGPPLPKGARAHVDSAYQGYDKAPPTLDFPHQKPKGGELTSEEKEHNRALSSFRVGVEHRIGRTKRFRIAGERFRNPLATPHAKASIVAGPVNIEAGFWPF